jgi:NAD(P)-dependent dehydrogenase (short-subunit alcohol dehydrogenase family)
VRRAVVTGAASGIGRATALLLLGRGANVVAADRDETGLAVVADAWAGIIRPRPGRHADERRRDRRHRPAAGVEREEYGRARLASVPLGRLGDPREVAEVIAFLISDVASYMTGRSVNVTGGMITY